MRRRAKRRRLPEVTPRWRAARNRLGQWVVVDLAGREVLRSPDEQERLRAVHLAAAAPGLLDSLKELVRRLAYLELPYSKDRQRVQVAQDEIAASRPPLDAQLQAMEAEHQLQLDLSDEVA